MPELGGQLARSVSALIFTVAGLAWLFPGSFVWAASAALAAAGIPLLAQPALAERDLRFREQGGVLSRFYLDALLGLVAIQAHGGQPAVQRAQAGQLRDWIGAGMRLQNTVVRIEAVQLALSLSLSFALVWRQMQSTTEPAGLLLLVYWSLAIPAIGSDIAKVLWHFPSLRNTTLRMLEPLGAVDDERLPPRKPEETFGTQLETAAPETPGVAIEMDRVSVLTGGHTVLEGVSLRLEPGEQVAVVGPSGAGKSSLAGLLLGWHKACQGSVLVDGEPLHGDRLERLRRQTAWIDPQIQLWNETLYHNLAYGIDEEEEWSIVPALGSAGLKPVLERLPEGLKTELGEGGGLLSGGEGQRVRMARAMVRHGARLVILDEPCRSLERGVRRKFIERAREQWPKATLICITHDVGYAATFDRVVAVQSGRIVEVGRPADLLSNPGGCYRRMCDFESVVREELWSSQGWRRLRMEQGRLLEDGQTERIHVSRPDVPRVARQSRG
jgi:ABC-type multidrug transport system fused ATPase/permease subunit